MAKDNILLEKSLKFAVRILALDGYLKKKKHEYVLSRQVVRSGTSIGANAHEAAYAVSRADFIAKLHISLKECAETEYWLRLLVLAGYVPEKAGESLLADCGEIKGILTATLKSMKGQTPENDT